MPQITSVAHEFLVATHTRKSAIVNEKLSHPRVNRMPAPSFAHAVAV
jgi:hypothetical protein